MSKVRRVLDLDLETDTRINTMVERKGQDAAAVLLESVIDMDGLDVEEDIRRLEEFARNRLGVPWDEVRAWMESWGTANELPPPQPRKIT
jgi:predicted transcriptional regulator